MDLCQLRWGPGIRHAHSTSLCCLLWDQKGLPHLSLASPFISRTRHMLSHFDRSSILKGPRDSGLFIDRVLIHYWVWEFLLALAGWAMASWLAGYLGLWLLLLPSSHCPVVSLLKNKNCVCVYEREWDVKDDLGFNDRNYKMAVYTGYHNCQVGPATQVTLPVGSALEVHFNICNCSSIYYYYKNSGK